MTRRGRYLLAGFLLLVGIVAAGSIIPALMRAKESGPGPAVWACFRNMRQIGLAMIQYAADHEDQFPESFGEMLKERYLTTSKVFLCRSTRQRLPADFPTNYAEADLSVLRTVDEWGAYAKPLGIRRDDPAEFIIVYEKSPAHELRELRAAPSKRGRERFRSLPDNTIIRPCMFNDGHTEYLPEEEFRKRLKAQEAEIQRRREVRRQSIRSEVP